MSDEKNVPEESGQTIINIGDISLLPASDGHSAVCTFMLMGVFTIEIVIVPEALKIFDQARLQQKKTQLDIVRTMPRNLRRVD